MIAFLVFALVVASASAVVVNKEVTRNIDATTAIVRVNTEIKASNVENEYQLIFKNDVAKNLAFLSVTSKGKALTTKAPVENQDYTTITVEVQESSPTLKVLTVFIGVLEPYPAEIAQDDNQLVRLKDSHYFYSPYSTESQKTTIKLATATIESYTKLSPHQSRGATIQYGSYKDIQPFEYSPATIHYVNNVPFAKFSSMIREVEVSHWGSIFVEEIYELKHAGAKLKGGFSRFDYQMKRGSTTPSFRSLITTLPGQANNIYYRDQIGNISTSDMRWNNDQNIELEIQTRFPIFGGWQTQFYLGYSVPTENYLYYDPENNKYTLKFDFYTGFEHVWVEDMEFKVILPEGSNDIQVNVPYVVEKSMSKRFTYLDSELNGGRPVIIIKSKNLVEEHDKQISITYTFQKNRMIVEPLMLVAVFFAFFMTCTIVSYTSKVVREIVKKSASNPDINKDKDTKND